MQQSSYSYDDLVNIDKTETGQITSITTNVTNMNKLKADIALAVSEKVAELEDTKVAIPLGSLLGSDLFSGTGPRLHVNLVPMGYAHIDFTNSFTEAGINQTKHQIDIIVKVNIGMLMPTGNETVEVSTSVPVAQTVIVGLIPDTYLNLQK